MTFGNFAQPNFGATEAKENMGAMPSDIGLSNKGLHSMLVEQAWAISPANFQKQAATTDLPAAGYGTGSRARLEGSATGPLPTMEVSAPQPARNVEGMTLRSVLSPVNGLRSRSTNNEAGTLTQASGWASTGVLDKPFVPREAPAVKIAEPVKVEAPRPVELPKTAELPKAVETAKPVPTAEVDVKAHPFFANLRAKPADPFAADNCYQSMEISPDGKITTTTTLPDLSSSKIEARYPDKSSTVAIADHLGRPTVEHRYDANGQLVSQTNTRFDNADSPMIPSNKIVKTASQTIETSMDATGKVIASKVMPYSDLNSGKVGV